MSNSTFAISAVGVRGVPPARRARGAGQLADAVLPIVALKLEAEAVAERVTDAPSPANPSSRCNCMLEPAKADGGTARTFGGRS